MVAGRAADGPLGRSGLSGLLDHAAVFPGGARRTATATAAQGGQSFSVACSEGQARLSGSRTEGYQALRCPECGEGVFVLLRSPAPRTVPRPRRLPLRSGGRRSMRSGAKSSESTPPACSRRTRKPHPRPDDEIEWVDEVPSTPAVAWRKPRKTWPRREIAARPTRPQTAPKPSQISANDRNPQPEPAIVAPDRTPRDDR